MYSYRCFSTPLFAPDGKSIDRPNHVTFITAMGYNPQSCKIEKKGKEIASVKKAQQQATFKFFSDPGHL